MLNLDVINAYDRICKSINAILQAYKVLKAPIYKSLGWSKNKFYEKMNSGKFTPDELRAVNRAIRNYRKPTPP